MSVWVIDADKINIDDAELNILYETRKVRGIIKDKSTLGIASVKGMGKTFLLKIKRRRHQLEGGILCLPKNSMVDIPSAPQIDSSIVKFLSDYNNWVGVWTVAIAISIIKSDNFACFKSNGYQNELSKNTVLLLNGDINRTCEIFDALLGMQRKELNNILKDSAILFNLLSSDKITSAVHIFIDKIDQAFQREIYRVYGDTRMSRGPRNASFWQYSQVALAHAAYNLYAKNSHIKVYYSIRKEALVDADKLTDTFENIRGYFTELDYSYNELVHMYQLYIQSEADINLKFPEYKKDDPSYAFIGISKLAHSYIKNYNEDLFDYIYRHTLKRPRDIMDMCIQLFLSSNSFEEIDEKKVKRIVNKESRMILAMFLYEMEPFMSILVGDKYSNQVIEEEAKDLESSASQDIIDQTEKANKLIFDSFALLANSNVMSKEMLKYICCAFNNNDVYSLNNNGDCLNCSRIHIFCILYNLGLLGYLEEDDEKGYIQRFNDLGNALFDLSSNHLPNSKLYLTHPMLTNKIESLRKDCNKTFWTSNRAIIGDQLPFYKIALKLVKQDVEKYLKDLKKNKKVFISSTCHDLHNERTAIKRVFEDEGYEVVLSESPDFNINSHYSHSHDHCIDEMLKCAHVIFIVGNRYGGEYNGFKYKTEADEIAKKDSSLKKPSVSLMEYYVAKKQSIPIHTYVNEAVFNERSSYKQNITSFNPAHAEDVRLFHIIDFITKQKYGNWFRQFRDLEHLIELCKIQFEYIEKD